MAKCPYHNIELVESAHNTKCVVCSICKRERYAGTRENTGIWDKDNLPSENVVGSQSTAKSGSFYLTNHRYVYGRAVLKSLIDALGVSEKEAKRLVFEAHAFGEVEIDDCSVLKRDKFHKLLSDAGYSQKLITDDIDSVTVCEQDISDLSQPMDMVFPTIDLVDDDDSF